MTTASASSYQDRSMDMKVPISIVSTVIPPDQMARRHTVASVVDAMPKNQPPILPPGWIEMSDPNGKSMFFNTKTGQTSWQRPTVRTLPLGWQKVQTPDGKTIFVHPETETMSYDFPSNSSTSGPRAASVAAVSARDIPRQVTDRKPLNRHVTAPTTRSPAMVNVNVNLDAVKAVPGIEEALAVHHLSTNNNCEVLSRQLGTNMSQTGIALRETTITAASLATRQAKVVTKTMLSPKRMQKFSKKMVVQTGAMSVHAARACKMMGKDMIDAADRKGKYQPKEPRQFVPYSYGIPQNHLQQGLVTITTSDQMSYPSKETRPDMGLTISASTSATMSMNLNSQIPSRKPLRKPVPECSHQESDMITNISSIDPASVIYSAGQGIYNSTTHQTIEKPPISFTAADVEALQTFQLVQQGQQGQQAPSRPSDRPQITKPGQPNSGLNQSGFQFNVQGHLQANASQEMEAALQSQQAIPLSRPQLQNTSSSTGPPPPYTQAPRPSRPSNDDPNRRPTQRPPQRRPVQARPQQMTQQGLPFQNDTSQGSTLEAITQTMGNTNLSRPEPQQITGSHPSPAQVQSQTAYQGQYSHTQNPATQQSNSYQSQGESQGYEQHHTLQQHPTQPPCQSIPGHQPYQEQQVNNQPAMSQDQSTMDNQQMQAQNYIPPDQHTTYNNPSAAPISTTYIDQNVTINSSTQADGAITNGGSGVVYEEVYFAGDGGMVAHEEVMYVDGAGGVVYGEATAYAPGQDEYEYTYEDEYGGEGEFGGEEFCIEEDYECEMEC